MEKTTKILATICSKSQSELIEIITKIYPQAIVTGDTHPCVFVKGDSNILFVSHLDTVHTTQCTVDDMILTKTTNISGTKSTNLLSSPKGIGGDDRVGVHMLMQLYSRLTIKPNLLFTTEEELGGLGIRDGYKTGQLETLLENINIAIEFDRAGKDHYVSYSYEHEVFDKYLQDTMNLSKEYGSYSDVATISSHGLYGVNIACGYERAHTTSETIDIDYVESLIELFIKHYNELCSFEKCTPTKKTYTYPAYVGGYSGGYYGGSDYYVDTYGYERVHTPKVYVKSNEEIEEDILELGVNPFDLETEINNVSIKLRSISRRKGKRKSEIIKKLHPYIGSIACEELLHGDEFTIVEAIVDGVINHDGSKSVLLYVRDIMGDTLPRFTISIDEVTPENYSNIIDSINVYKSKVINELRRLIK